MNARDEVKDEIKSRLEIEDVVGRYVELKRSGASLKGLCPFHQEKTPSFYVSPQRGTYHCFGCGRGGDIFQFVMEMEHLQFPDALRRLGDQAGVTIPEREAQRPSLKGALFGANDAAARFFKGALETGEGKRAVEYLYERGFAADAIARFDLGYAPRGGEALARHLQSGGLDSRILLAAGLAIEDEGSGRLRDRFRGRLIFPIRDAAGKVSGFGGRVLGDGLPKYLNSPQTEIFDKSSVLFGIHLAQDAIRQAGRAVLVEGYLDAVRAHIGGFAFTVASLGTAVTVPQLTALARLTDVVILALDPDPAGQNAAARTALTALLEVTQRRSKSATTSGTLDLRIAQLPPGGGDPDDLIRDTPELWERVLGEAVPAFEFVFTRTLEAIDRSSSSWREQALNQLLPLIRQFAPSPGQQAVWIEWLAGETGISAKTLARSMPGRTPRAAVSTRGQEVKKAVASATAKGLAIEEVAQRDEDLLALLLQILVIPREATKPLAELQLDRPEHQLLLHRLLTWQNYDYELFAEDLPDHVRAVADELRDRKMPLPPDSKLSLAIKLHLSRRRQARLQSEFNRATQALANIGPEDQAGLAENVSTLSREKRAVEAEVGQLEVLIRQSGRRTPASLGND